MKYSKQEIIDMIRDQHKKDLENLIDFLERALPEDKLETEKEGL